MDNKTKIAVATLILSLAVAGLSEFRDARAYAREKSSSAIKLDILQAFQAKRALSQEALIAELQSKYNKPFCKCFSQPSSAEIKHELYILTKEKLVVFSQEANHFELLSHTTLHPTINMQKEQFSRSPAGIKFSLLKLISNHNKKPSDITPSNFFTFFKEEFYPKDGSKPPSHATVGAALFELYKDKVITIAPDNHKITMALTTNDSAKNQTKSN